MKNIIKNSIFVLILVAFSFGPSFVFAGSMPSIVSTTATNVTTNSVDLNGIINPNGDDTTAWFETLDGGPYQVQNLGNGTSDVPMLAYTLSGLTQGTNYSFRIITGNVNGPVEGSWISFTTVSAPSPTIVSGTATNITQTSADLTGVINPNEYNTTAWFETPSGGPFQTQNIGNGSSNVPILSYNLSGLTPNTNYTFKIIAGNANGSADSGWISFTTLHSSGGGSTPTLDSISPSNGTQGQTLSVNLTGTNFANGATSDFGSGITVNSTNFVSSTSLTANITISGSATTGARNVTVTSGGQTTGSQTFTVNSINPPPPGCGGCGSSSYPPYVITQNAISITTNSSTLNGSINPRGYATTGWFEYGTSTTSLGTSNGLQTAHISLGLGTTATALSQNLTNLSSDTTYYFRAVANNTYGTVKGNIFSFKTEKVTITAPVLNVSITTVQATNKTSTFAKLNGIFINQTGIGAQAYFKYGKTSSLNKTTPIKNLGSVSSISFSEAITNLEPDTIYFFRAVGKNQGTIYNGNILVFKTLKEVVVAPLPTTPVTNEENSTVIANSVENPIVEDQIDYSNITTAELGITNSTENVSIGDEINYVVNFKNVTSKDLENVKIIVQLPEEVDFKESNLGKIGNDNTVVFETQNLVPNQIGSITIKGTVNTNASLKNILVTTAMMSYNIAGLTLNKDETAYTTNNVVEKSTGLEANPLFSINSLPYLLGYLALLLIILGLIIIGRKVYIENKLNKSTKIITDHINNLEK